MSVEPVAKASEKRLALPHMKGRIIIQIQMIQALSISVTTARRNLKQYPDDASMQ